MAGGMRAGVFDYLHHPSTATLTTSCGTSPGSEKATLKVPRWETRVNKRDATGAIHELGATGIAEGACACIKERLSNWVVQQLGGD